MMFEINEARLAIILEPQTIPTPLAIAIASNSKRAGPTGAFRFKRAATHRLAWNMQRDNKQYKNNKGTHRHSDCSTKFPNQIEWCQTTDLLPKSKALLELHGFKTRSQPPLALLRHGESRDIHSVDKRFGLPSWAIERASVRTRTRV